MTKETQEIILYKEEEATALKLYRNDGLDPFIENIRKVAEEFEADVTTEKGRKAYKSLAYKISQAKTKVEEIRKAENEEHQAAITANNKKGKKAVAELQTIQDEVKEPVTQWEARIERHQLEIERLETLAHETCNWFEDLPISEMQKAVDEIKNHQRDWQEFSFKAENVKRKAIEDIEAAIAKRKKHEADKLELERLQKAEEERKQKEREAAIAKEAAERVRIEAELKAKQEREAEIKRAAEAKAKAAREAEALKKQAEQRELKLKQERERAENDKKEAEERAKRAELARIEAEKQAEIDKQKAKEAAELKEIEDAKKREAERQKLITDLQRRADEEKAAKQAEIDKRKADKEHKEKITLEAESALIEMEGFPSGLAKSVITAIIEGKIPHVTFNY